MNTEREHAARDLLAFYVEAGVTSVVGDVPVNRFEGWGEPPPAPPAMPAPPTIAPPGRSDRAAGTQPQSALVAPVAPALGAATLATPEAAVMAAREAAAAATSLDELRSIAEGFEGCALKRTAKQLVFADGTPGAPLMLVGEAPGREEDIEGLPFVGRSGQLLDRMLAAIGLDRSSAYIANIIPWRPPGNRTPTPQEVAICMPFIRRQIELADPAILVCLGGPAATALLNLKEGIVKSRGRWCPYLIGRREIRAMPTFHPAYLLRQPLQKRLAWRDLLAIQRALRELPQRG